uniref:Uncharacterized protein n=1 Tax=Gorilla gorilla gorilla TaxID=9595 RepID=A0A2I2Y8U1_GORGO
MRKRLGRGKELQGKREGLGHSPDFSAPGDTTAMDISVQVMFPDASEVGSRKQLSSASRGPEKGPRHRDAFEKGPSELRIQEQGPPARPGKKQSSWVPQEGSQELQAGQDQSELGLLPSWVPEQLGSGKEIKGQQGRQRNRGIGEDQPIESCQAGRGGSRLLIPALLEAEADRSPEVKTSLANMVKPCLY